MSKDAILFRVRLLDRLVDEIYAMPRKLQHERLGGLITQNDQVCFNTTLGFYHRGKKYTQARFRGVPNFNMLDEKLVPMMEEWLIEENEMESEIPLVKAYLRQLLNSSDDPLEVLRRIPLSIRTGLTKTFEAAGLGYSELTPREDFSNEVECSEKCFAALKKRLMFNLLT